MKLTQVHAKALFLKILHEDRKELRKLNQFQRKLCLRAIEALTHPQKKIEIQLPKKVTYEQTIEKLSDKLESLPNEQTLRLIKLLISLCKKILNRLSLRISSKEVESKIKTLSTRFAVENWYEYINEYCTVIGSPSDPKIIFLGDNHSDPRQNKVRSRIMALDNHLHPEQNFLFLFEGNVRKHHEKFNTWDTWERGTHYTEVLEALDAHVKIEKEIERLIHGSYTKNTFKRKITPLIAENARLQNRINKLNQLRDLDLVETVKENILNQPQRTIYVIAGTAHLFRKDFDVRSYFPENFCALVIPKTRPLAHKMLPLLNAKMVEQGRYGWNL